MTERIFTVIGCAIAFSVWGVVAALFLIMSLPFILLEVVAGDR